MTWISETRKLEFLGPITSQCWRNELLVLYWASMVEQLGSSGMTPWGWGTKPTERCWNLLNPEKYHLCLSLDMLFHPDNCAWSVGNKENINERTESLVVRFCVSHFFSQAGKIAFWTAIFVYFNASKRNPAQGQTPSRGKEVANKRTNSLCHSAFWRLASRLLGNEALSS